MITKKLVLGMVGVLMASASAAFATPQTPEFQLVEGFFAAGAGDLQTQAGRAQYQQTIQNLVSEYAANHTTDPATASRNLADAFTTIGIPAQEVSQVRALSARYAALLGTRKTSEMTTEQMQAFWRQYGHDLTSTLATMPYPQGEEFSACQWSVALMAGGLAVGIPIMAYTIGEAMGDQNVSPWIANPGAIAFLIGIGGLVATIPTCLF